VYASKSSSAEELEPYEPEEDTPLNLPKAKKYKKDAKNTPPTKLLSKKAKSHSPGSGFAKK